MYSQPVISPVRPETEGVCQDLAVDGDELFHGGQICLLDMSLEAAVLSLQQVLAVLQQLVVVGDEAAPALAGLLPLLHQLHLVPAPDFQPNLHDEPQLVREVEAGGAEDGALLSVLLLGLLPAGGTAVGDETAGRTTRPTARADAAPAVTADPEPSG